MVEVLLIAFGTDGSPYSFLDVTFKVVLVYFYVNHRAEKCWDQVAAHQNHIKIQDAVKKIGEVASGLKLDKNLVCTHLKVLIHVAKHSHGVVLEILPWVH